MIRIWHVAVFAGVLAIAIIAMTPARFFLHPRAGEIVYREVEGTIWSPTLLEAKIGDLDAGTISLTVSPLELLIGRLAIDIAIKGLDIQGSGRFESALNGHLRVKVNNLVVSGVPLSRLRDLPGSTRLEDVDIIFSDRVCRSARGHAQSDALARAADILAHNGPNLAGDVSCQGPVARIRLAGERDGDQVEALLDVSGDGTATWAATYATPERDVAAMLIAAGLPPETQPGVFTSRGKVRWLPY